MGTPTGSEWNVAADSYGKVRHSRKACVYTVLKGKNGTQIVTIAARIPNWEDAKLMAAAKDMYRALKQMNAIPESEGGYCICPRAKNSIISEGEHSSACEDARKAVAHAEGHREQGCMRNPCDICGKGVR